MFFLSIWGAVTGTVGTILGIISITLKIKEFNRNKPNLVCKSQIKYSTINNLDVRIFISSTGRTPVQINKIKVYVLPRKFWMRVLKSYYYKKRKAILELNVPKTKLNEQEKIDFKLDIPQGLEYSDIYKISIIDGVDKEWPVDWPSVSTVKEKTKKTQIKQFEIKQGEQSVILTSYQIGKRFYLEVEYKIPLKGSYTPGRWFNKKKELMEMIEHILSKQEKKFMNGEIDRITLS